MYIYTIFPFIYSFIYLYTVTRAAALHRAPCANRPIRVLTRSGTAIGLHVVMCVSGASAGTSSAVVSSLLHCGFSSSSAVTSAPEARRRRNVRG